MVDISNYVSQWFHWLLNGGKITERVCCPDCNGVGYISSRYFLWQRRCELCNGTGGIEVESKSK